MAQLPYLFGFAAGVCALIAAYYGFKASSVRVRPPWDIDPTIRPDSIERYNFGLANALEAAMFWSGRATKTASFWAVAAGIFGILSTLFALLG